MARANNYPTVVQPSLTKEELSSQIKTFSELRSWGTVTTDTEIEARIGQYFSYCAEHSLRPGIEGLCAALGIKSRQTLINWSNRGGKRGELIDRAKSVIAALLEQWSLTGKLNPATSIFLMKNWLNYRDTSEIEVGTRQDIEPTRTLEQLAADIPIDFVDDEDEYHGNVEQDIPLD